MDPGNADVIAYIGRWRPSSVSPPAAAFAREVITEAGPEGQERAKNLCGQREGSPITRHRWAWTWCPG
jgi:hypothetical protein